MNQKKPSPLSSLKGKKSRPYGQYFDEVRIVTIPSICGGDQEFEPIHSHAVSSAVSRAGEHASR